MFMYSKCIKILGLWVFVFSLSGSIQAQSSVIEARTTDGKTVLLSPDGTWKYKPSNVQMDDDRSTYAIVYFVRYKETFGMANRDRGVNINDKEFFKMPQSRFIGLKLKAGAYKLKMQQTKSELNILVEAGKTYYVRVSETTSGMGNDQSITELTEKQGIFQISLVQVLEDSKLKASSELFIREKPVVTTP